MSNVGSQTLVKFRHTFVRNTGTKWFLLLVGWLVGCCFLFCFCGILFVCLCVCGFLLLFLCGGGGGGGSLKMYFIISYRWLFSLLMPVLVWVLCVVVSASKDVSRLVGVSVCAFFVQSVPSSATGCPASFPMQPAVLVFGQSAVTHLPCPPMKTQQ